MVDQCLLDSEEVIGVRSLSEEVPSTGEVAKRPEVGFWKSDFQVLVTDHHSAPLQTLDGDS